ncbi:MAG: hypothetical protein IPK50_23570 [Fibrobacterota bacterium]|nr:MAG: hypothetical protein IPK50_23570 [Fibrobacterota bacterium]
MMTESFLLIAILASVTMGEPDSSCKKDSAGMDVDAIPKENLLQSCRTVDSVALDPRLPHWPKYPSTYEVVMMLGKYAECGDTSSVQRIFHRVQGPYWLAFSTPLKASFYQKMSLAYEIRGRLDVALGALDSAEAYVQGANIVSYGRIHAEIRQARSRVLEKLNRSPEIVRLWGSECHGPGEEILARALRKELGVKNVIAEYQAGVSKVEHDRLHGKLDAKGRFICHSMFQIPETGERGIFAYFGPIRVRVRIGPKVCYLPAPQLPSDTSATTRLYLDHFAKTPFSQVLLGNGSLGKP